MSRLNCKKSLICIQGFMYSGRNTVRWLSGRVVDLVIERLLFRDKPIFYWFNQRRQEKHPHMTKINNTVKPVLSSHSNEDQRLIFKTDYRLMHIKRIANVLQNAPREHFSILSTCIKLPSVTDGSLMQVESIEK